MKKALQILENRKKKGEEENGGKEVVGWGDGLDGEWGEDAEKVFFFFLDISDNLFKFASHFIYLFFILYFRSWFNIFTKLLFLLTELCTLILIQKASV